MLSKRIVLGSLSGAMAFLFVTSSWAADLAEIKQRGEIRHIGDAGFRQTNWRVLQACLLRFLFGDP